MDNRNELIRTACQLFATRGYDAVGVQEIVENSGLTKPTLYHYFGSKQGLLEAILETYMRTFLQELTKETVYQGDMIGSLQRIVNLYFEYASKEPAFFWLWVTTRLSPAESSAYQVFSTWLREEYLLINQMFQKAANQHGNLVGRQHAYTVTFLGMIFTYASLGLRGEQQMNQQLVFSAVQQFLYGIFS